MAFKLIEAAQDRWRAVNAPHLVAVVRAGAKFERGKLIERENEETAHQGRLIKLSHPQVLTIALLQKLSPMWSTRGAKPGSPGLV